MSCCTQVRSIQAVVPGVAPGWGNCNSPKRQGHVAGDSRHSQAAPGHSETLDQPYGVSSELSTMASCRQEILRRCRCSKLCWVGCCVLSLYRSRTKIWMEGWDVYFALFHLLLLSSLRWCLGSVQAGDWMDHMVHTVWAVEVMSLPKPCGVFS